MRSPIRWFGGKGNFTQHLLPLIPDHKCYVEVFGGGASLLFAKPPSKVEVYNDIDGDVVAFFRLFHDPEAMKEFKRKCFYTPYSREWYLECRDTWREQKGIERVYRWFIVVRMQFSGRMYEGGASLASTQNRAAETRDLADNLDSYVNRLRNVQIDNRSWEHVIGLYDSPATFFYLDPPYIHQTRSGGRGYDHEMSDDDHDRLINVLASITGKVLLSNYPNEVYDTLGWNKDEINQFSWSSGRKGKTGLESDRRTECLWRNYEIQPALF